MVMKRDKIIRKIGDSVGIIFNKEERTIYDLKINDNVFIQVEKKNKPEVDKNDY